jgi:hypothetical protein
MSALRDLYEAGVRDDALFIPQTTGVRWSLLDPDPAALNWRDLAMRLARRPRFGGAAAWSLAEHSLLVMRLCPAEAKAWALLHDAHEGFLGDWVTPVKGALRALGAGDALATLERVTAKAIQAAAGLPMPTEAIAREVVHADLVALATERRDVLDCGAASGWGSELPPPAPLGKGRLKALPVERVAEDFLAALRNVVGVAPERAR